MARPFKKFQISEEISREIVGSIKAGSPEFYRQPIKDAFPVGEDEEARIELKIPHNRYNFEWLLVGLFGLDLGVVQNALKIENKQGYMLVSGSISFPAKSLLLLYQRSPDRDDFPASALYYCTSGQDAIDSKEKISQEAGHEIRISPASARLPDVLSGVLSGKSSHVSSPPLEKIKKASAIIDLLYQAAKEVKAQDAGKIKRKLPEPTSSDLPEKPAKKKEPVQIKACKPREERKEETESDYVGGIKSLASIFAWKSYWTPKVSECLIDNSFYWGGFSDFEKIITPKMNGKESATIVCRDVLSFMRGEHEHRGRIGYLDLVRCVEELTRKYREKLKNCASIREENESLLASVSMRKSARQRRMPIQNLWSEKRATPEEEEMARRLKFLRSFL
jgi:hypothetical protein